MSFVLVHSMTADQFRELALGLPEAVEIGHMGHPDFRVRNKIFATLGYPNDQWAMVKLTPEQQEQFVEDEPDVFAPIKGGWGRKGATRVDLADATPKVVKPALLAAWKNVAPKKLAESIEED
jgi:hypothetical protein